MNYKEEKQEHRNMEEIRSEMKMVSLIIKGLRN